MSYVLFCVQLGGTGALEENSLFVLLPPPINGMSCDRLCEAAIRKTTTYSAISPTHLHALRSPSIA